MAEIDWGNLLTNIYGYTQQAQQGREQYELAQEAVRNAEAWGENYLRNFQNTYANELAGNELASESAYRTAQLAETESELGTQAAASQKAMQARLASLGALRGSGQIQGSRAISDAQIKALAKAKTQIDAQILSAVQQRQMAAKQGLMGAEANVAQRVQSVQDMESKAKLAMLQSLQLTPQQLAGVLPLVNLGTDYLGQIASGGGFNIMDTYNQDIQKSLPENVVAEAAMKGIDLSKVKVKEKKYAGGVKDYSGVAAAVKAHSDWDPSDVVSFVDAQNKVQLVNKRTGEIRAAGVQKASSGITKSNLDTVRATVERQNPDWTVEDLKPGELEKADKLLKGNKIPLFVDVSSGLDFGKRQLVAVENFENTGEIKVRLKKDTKYGKKGQEGTIPPGDFRPNLYELAD